MVVKSYSKRRELAFKEGITLAYLNAMWTIQWLGKRHQQPRPLKEILNSIGREKRVMTDEQMFKQIQVLNMLFGGEVKRVGKK